MQRVLLVDLSAHLGMSLLLVLWCSITLTCYIDPLEQICAIEFLRVTINPNDFLTTCVATFYESHAGVFKTCSIIAMKSYKKCGILIKIFMDTAIKAIKVFYTTESFLKQN